MSLLDPFGAGFQSSGHDERELILQTTRHTVIPERCLYVLIHSAIESLRCPFKPSGKGYPQQKTQPNFGHQVARGPALYNIKCFIPSHLVASLFLCLP